MAFIARCFLQEKYLGGGGNELYRYKLQLYLLIFSFILLKPIISHSRHGVPHFPPSPYSSPRLLPVFKIPHPACA